MSSSLHSGPYQNLNELPSDPRVNDRVVYDAGSDGQYLMEWDGSEWLCVSIGQTGTKSYIQNQGVNLGGAGGSGVKFGLTEEQRSRLNFAWRSTGDASKIATKNHTSDWPLYTPPPSDGSLMAPRDMTGKTVSFNYNTQMNWDSTENALTNASDNVGIEIDNVEDYWNEYIAGDNFAILLRVKLDVLPSTYGAAFHPLLQTRSGASGLSWNLRTDDETIRVRPKDSNGNDILDVYDTTIASTFDTSQYHDFIVTGDGVNVDVWYDDNKLASHTYQSTENVSLGRNNSFMRDQQDGSLKVPGYLNSILFDTQYWTQSDIDAARNWAGGNAFA